MLPLLPFEPGRLTPNRIGRPFPRKVAGHVPGDRGLAKQLAGHSASVDRHEPGNGLHGHVIRPRKPLRVGPGWQRPGSEIGGSRTSRMPPGHCRRFSGRRSHREAHPRRGWRGLPALPRRVTFTSGVADQRADGVPFSQQPRDQLIDKPRPVPPERRRQEPQAAFRQAETLADRLYRPVRHERHPRWNDPCLANARHAACRHRRLTNYLTMSFLAASEYQSSPQVIRPWSINPPMATGAIKPHPWMNGTIAPG